MKIIPPGLIATSNLTRKAAGSYKAQFTISPLNNSSPIKPEVLKRGGNDVYVYTLARYVSFKAGRKLKTCCHNA